MKVSVTFLPDDKTVVVHSGMTVLAAAARAGVRLSQRCAGKAACLTCKVRVDEQSGISLPNQKEQYKLGPLLDEHLRLACQSVIRGHTIVHVPEDPLKAFIRAQLQKQSEGWSDD